MSKKKSNHLGLIKDYIIKCRLEQSTGTTEEPIIMTYHTFIIQAVSLERAIEEATIRAGAEASYPYVVKIEYTAGGSA
jgi:hypothetical protein